MGGFVLSPKVWVQYPEKGVLKQMKVKVKERRVGLFSRLRDLGAFGLQSLTNSIHSVFV